MSTSQLTIESALPDGSPANADSFGPDISDDGRFLAFHSSGATVRVARTDAMLRSPKDGGCFSAPEELVRLTMPPQGQGRSRNNGRSAERKQVKEDSRCVHESGRSYLS